MFVDLVEEEKEKLKTWDEFVESVPLIVKERSDFERLINEGKAIIKRDAESGLDQLEVNQRYEFIQEIVAGAYKKKIAV